MRNLELLEGLDVTDKQIARALTALNGVSIRQS
jgi:hypothetical protein